MDMQALAARLGKLTDQGSSKKTWFRPNEEDQTVRILPYPHQDGNMSFIEVYFHYDIAGHKSIACPESTLGADHPCPICRLADEFKNMGGKENWFIFRDMSAKLRTYSPVIIRGKEDQGVKLWGYGKTSYEQLLTTCMEEGDITNLEEGHDLNVKQIPVGAPGNDSTFPKPVCKVSFKQSPAMKNKTEAKKIIAEIPNYIEDPEVFRFMDYDQLCEIVEKLKTGDSADTEYGKKEEEITVTPNAPKRTESNSDLKGQLDSLLDDDLPF